MEMFEDKDNFSNYNNEPTIYMRSHLRKHELAIVFGRFNDLFRVIGTTDKLLSNEEIDSLIQDYKDGNQKAGNEVIRSYTKFVIRYIVEHYKGLWSAHLEDFVQEGLIGLASAMDHYDPGKGATFGTYAGYWIKKRVFRYIQKNCYQISRPQKVFQELRQIDSVRDECELSNKEISLEALSKRSGVSVKRIQALDRMRKVDDSIPIDYESDDI